MIKIENTDVWGFEHAVRAMRNPMNSWGKGDSEYPTIRWGAKFYNLGPDDIALMKRLYKAGVEHRTYARMIQVSMDITAPLYWWKEMDRYTVGKSQVSCSTMHKIADKEFELDDFSHEHLDTSGLSCLNGVITNMNDARHIYLNGFHENGYDAEPRDKTYWWQMIQLLPSSYNQKRTVCMSYETVFKIIKERTGHKLDEWNDFVAELMKLPYVEEIIGGEKDDSV